MMIKSNITRPPPCLILLSFINSNIKCNFPNSLIQKSWPETKNSTAILSRTNFMKRAYRSDRNFRRGIDNSVFRLLEHIENGHYGKKSDYPRQVQKLKTI